MPTFPNPADLLRRFDPTAVDFSKLDVSKIDVSKLPKLDLAKVDTERLVAVLRDAAYVVIGFGVLTVQQAQVRRRELADKLAAHPAVQQLGATREQLEEFLGGFETRIADLDARIDAFESKLDDVVEQVERKLPEQAGAVLGTAHELARTARQQVRGLIRSAA
jgi:hypothetical protein